MPLEPGAALQHNTANNAPLPYVVYCDRCHRLRNSLLDCHVSALLICKYLPLEFLLVMDNLHSARSGVTVVDDNVYELNVLC